MLLKSYSKEIFRPECNPNFESVHCIAHLEQDISAVLPYLNAVLGGFDYLKDPPAVIFRSQGKLITVHGCKIAINALKDEDEADKILAWLQREINDAWENRNGIEPSYEGAPKPEADRDPQAASQDQLQGMRRAHLHGVCRPHGRGSEGSGGLPANGFGRKTAARRIHAPI